MIQVRACSIGTFFLCRVTERARGAEQRVRVAAAVEGMTYIIYYRCR